MKIALLDDGIELSHCPGLNLCADPIVDPTGHIRTRTMDEKIYTDHGTTCAQIIHSYVPDAELCSLQIFSGGTLRADLRQLLAALGWCIDNHIPLVHLSAGSTKLSDYSQIREIVYRMLSGGQFLVAAQSNHPDRYTLPACLNGVFGVTADPTLSDLSYRIDEYSSPGGAKIYASSSHKLNDCESNSYKTQITNSYAAPTITARLYQILDEKEGKTDTLYGIYSKLVGKRKVSLHSMYPDFLVSAIVFDPQNTLILQECLDFTPLYILNDYSIFFRKVCEHPTAPVLLIPPIPSETVFLRKLCSLSQNRLGVAYAGHCQALSSFPCLTWHEGDRDVLFSKLPLYNQFCFKTPVVQIESCNDDAIKFICQLRKMLVADGIESLMVSDISKSYLYGIEYLPKERNFLSLLTHFSHIYQPDIVVCAFSKLKCDRKNGALHVNLTNDCTHFKGISENTILFPCMPKEDDWHLLLKFLFDHDF